MKVTVLAVGKIKEAYMRQAIADYSKRISRYCRLEIREAAEEPSVAQEGDSLLRMLPDNAYVIALDLQGKTLNSLEFASFLDRAMTGGTSHFVLVIGGSDGLDPRVLERADFRFCLSRLTFPHQLARLLILEQWYRAMKINHGEKYHK